MCVFKVIFPLNFNVFRLYFLQKFLEGKNQPNLITCFVVGIRFYIFMPFDIAVPPLKISPTEIITQMDKDIS